MEQGATPYQHEDAQRLYSWKGRGLVGHETGLGKSFIALFVRNKLQRLYLNQNVPFGRTIILGSVMAVAAWKIEVAKWLKIEPVIVEGQEWARRKAWSCMAEDQNGIWICTYDSFMRDLKTHPTLNRMFRMAICDEAHRIRNRNGHKRAAVKQLKVSHLLIASATLASRGPQDLWSYLNLVDSKFFSSYWRFVNTWCEVEEGMFGKNIVGVKNADKLNALLYNKYYTERKFNEVYPQLPPKRREAVELVLDEDQRKAYDPLDAEMLLELGDGSVLVTPTILAKVTRLRQLAVCPRMLGPELPLGSAAAYILSALEDDPHTVIFSCFTKALEVMQEELARLKYKTYMLRGGMKPDEILATAAAFKRDKAVMLCSIGVAESYSLDTVNTSYFWGFDWDPNKNTQAEGRLRRMDSQLGSGGVLCKYLLPLGTVEEDVREVINDKHINVETVLRRRKSFT